MIGIKNDSINPFFNLALEEYALKKLDFEEDSIILWQNEPSVIIGRNQNTIEEINPQYIKNHKINVVRRLSGGGAVYHDLGNLNFTFITKNSREDTNNFKKFTEPIIEALRTLNINATFSGRNDITIEGKKFSGNAQYYYGGKLLHHGTVLFDSDLDVVKEALNVKLEKIQSKGIKSIRSRVTNISPYLNEAMSIHTFKDFLLQFLLNTSSPEEKEYTLTNEDLKNIQGIMKDKYMTWKWNYGESPDFDIHKSRRYSAGSLDLRFNIVKGFIEDIRIYGDFFGRNEIEKLEERLKHSRFNKGEIRSILQSIPINQFIKNISGEDFIDCMFY